jgi:hypothetical protein
MADTTIVVAAVGAAATLFVASFGAVTTVLGYWLSGRHDEARDKRALEREQIARKEDRNDRLQEQRHEWQRQTLLDLQDELQKLARATGKILHHDLMTVREKGGVFQLGDAALNDDYLAATVAVQKLCARVLDDGLRGCVRDFVGFCGYASTGAILPHKDAPPEFLEGLINGLTADMATRYPDLTERLGARIRGELGRS